TIISTLKVKVRQTLPNKSVLVYDTIMASPAYLDTFYFKINRNNLSIQGINKFDIYVNADSAISETDFKNNHASFSYYFKGNGVRALFPTDFNIVNSDSPVLMA